MRQAREEACSRYDALVLNMNMRSGLLFARSLGAGGRRVAGATWALPAPGLRSKHVAARVKLPELDRSGRCAHAIEAFVAAHPTDVVISTSDGGVELLTEHRAAIARYAAPAVGSPEAVEVALSKAATAEAAAHVDVPMPTSLAVSAPEDVTEAGNDLGWPVVLKPFHQFRGRPDGSVESVKPRLLRGPDDAIGLEDVVRSDAPAFVQEVLTGVREMHVMLRDRGTVLLHVALEPERFWPEFGVSAHRTTVPIPEDTGALARRMLAGIGLDGPALIEFRRDEDGRPRLLEINARATQGPPETLVQAGIDFPTMVFDWARGAPVEPVTRYPTGVRTGWLAADLARVLAGAHVLDARPRPRLRTASKELVASYVLGRSHPEGLDVRDPAPLAATLHARVVGAAGLLRRR